MTESAHIPEVVRKASMHWRMAGVPRSIRRRRAEELTDHLTAATADGRSINDVVGTDLAAFAAEWARAGRPHLVIGLVLQVLAGVLAGLGFFALIGALDPDAGGIGLTPGSLAVLGTVMVGSLGVQAVRARRDLFTRQQVGLLVIAYIAYFVAAYAFVFVPAFDSTRFWAVHPLVVAALLVSGFGLQTLHWWLTKNQRM